MTDLKFRKLRADEIDCRISTCNQYGVGLLLYKDARCDQNILDETVGAMNWQRHHNRENANCIVAIWDSNKSQWIEKEDTGTESYTEKEKGLASDSFKRACFNWGIGRELYTAPNMFVFAEDLKTLQQDSKSGKWTCRDFFTVTEIEYDGDKISVVKIRNEKNDKEIVFGKAQKPKAQTKAKTQAKPKAEAEQKKIAAQKITEAKVKTLASMCEKDKVPADKIKTLYKVSSFADLTEKQFKNILEHWKDIKAAE